MSFCHCYRRKKQCDVSSASLDYEALPRWDLLLKERNGSKFFPLRADSHESGRVVSPKGTGCKKGQYMRMIFSGTLQSFAVIKQSQNGCCLYRFKELP